MIRFGNFFRDFRCNYSVGVGSTGGSGGVGAGDSDGVGEGSGLVEGDGTGKVVPACCDGTVC